MRARKIEIELRSTSDKEHHLKLLNEGGKAQVPCLLIEQNGERVWLYESDDIVAYLTKNGA